MALRRVFVFPDDSLTSVGSVETASTNTYGLEEQPGSVQPFSSIIPHHSSADESVGPPPANGLVEAISKHLILSDNILSEKVSPSKHSAMPSVDFSPSNTVAERSSTDMSSVCSISSSKSEVSDIFLSSCLKVSEICSNLVETSNQKLSQVLSDGGDFANANFSSSFDKMFESVVDDDGDGDFIEETSVDDHSRINVRKCNMVKFNDESVMQNQRDEIDTGADCYLTDLEASPQTLRVDQAPLLDRCHGKSKVCIDEMDVDYFLSGEGDSDTRRSKINKRDLQEKFSNVEFPPVKSEGHNPDVSKYHKKIQFDAIPEDDEANISQSDTSSTSGSVHAELTQAGSESARLSRPTTLPLFSDMSRKEFSLHSPKHEKSHSVARRHSDHSGGGSHRGGRFASKSNLRSPLKLSPYQPSFLPSVNGVAGNTDDPIKESLSSSLEPSIDELPEEEEDANVALYSDDNELQSRSCLKTRSCSVVTTTEQSSTNALASISDDAEADVTRTLSVSSRTTVFSQSHNTCSSTKRMPSNVCHPVNHESNLVCSSSYTITTNDPTVTCVSSSHNIVSSTVSASYGPSPAVHDTLHHRIGNGSCDPRSPVPLGSDHLDTAHLGSSHHGSSSQPIPRSVSVTSGLPPLASPHSPRRSVARPPCGSPSQYKLGITSICGSPLRGARTWSSSALVDEANLKMSRSLPGSPHKV